MESIRTVLAAIARQLNDQTGIRAGDIVPPKVNPPELFLQLTSSTPGTFGADSLDIELDVIVFVSTATERNQHLLYDYVSLGTTQSIFDALAFDSTFGLDGVSGSAGVFRNLAFEEIAAYEMYGGAVPVSVSIT